MYHASLSINYDKTKIMIKNIENPRTEVTERKTFINPLNANFTKWSNTLKQFVGNLPTNRLSKFDHFVGLVLKVLRLPKIQIVDDFKYLGAYIANCHTDFKRLA